MLKKYTIGLDIGINNVGWAIYDSDDNKILKTGVRTFNQSNSAADRRNARNVRRRLKRRDNRVRDALNELKEINFPDVRIIDSFLINKRCSGINAKIEKQDITNIICYLMSYRGYIPYGDEEVKFAELNDKLPCEFYKELSDVTGFYRNSNLIVKNTDNLKELNTMLNKQMQYYPEITNKFIENINSIFTRKRKFWEGPGSIKSITKYGRFKNKEDVDNYLKNKESNTSYETYLYENLIRNCDISKDEKCAPKINFYAEYFNLLNDFINISFKNIEEIKNQEYVKIEKDSIKINSNGLLAIKDYCLNNTSLRYTDIFKNILGTNFDNVRGYRIDKKGKPEFSTFNYFRIIYKMLVDNNKNTDWTNDINTYNRIIYSFNVAPGKVELFNMINNDERIEYEFNAEELEIIYNLYKKFQNTSPSVLTYHNLSEKTLIRAIDDMVEYCLNYMQVSKKFDYEKESREKFIKDYCDTSEGLTKMNKKFVDDIVASPQVKKSLRQAIKVINEIIKEQKGYPYIISVESTKEMNGKEKIFEINREQKHNEELRKKAIVTLHDRYGDTKVNETNILKTILYEEANEQCMYCSKPVSLDEVLSSSYNIEHIIPFSKTFDDSYDNKTIACWDCNKNKGNNTPYSFLSSDRYVEFKDKVNKMDLSEKKKKYLLFEDNIDKYNIRFFNRNLRDTAYATTELINQINIFNYYLDAKKNNTEILTFSTPGQLTHKLREINNLEKDRDDGLYHHAVDAAIVASIPNTSPGKYILNSQNDPKFYTKEKNNISKNANLIKSINISSTIDDIRKINNDNIKVSSQIIKTTQSQLSNANIIKVIKKEDNFFKIGQINNIYNFKTSDKATMNLLEKLFNDADKTNTLLCKDNNIEQYYMLQKIFNDNKLTKGNPFVDYCIEKEQLKDNKDFDYRKHGIKMSNNPNSPIVIRLRYYTSMTEPYLIEKESIKKHDNTYIALDSLSQYCTRVYVDLEENKFLFLPIYTISLDPKTKDVRKNEKFYMQFYNKYINNKKVEFIADIHNGEYLEIIKSDGSKIEGNYQYFHKTNNKICLKNDTYFTKSDRGFTVFNVDVLGNKYKRLTKYL